MAFAGVIAGILYSGLGMIYDLMTIGWNHGTTLAFLAIPIMPLYFAGFGFISALIGGFLYNLFAKKFGKINLKIEK